MTSGGLTRQFFFRTDGPSVLHGLRIARRVEGSTSAFVNKRLISYGNYKTYRTLRLTARRETTNIR